MAEQPQETFEQRACRETKERFIRIVTDLQKEVKAIKGWPNNAETSRKRRRFREEDSEDYEEENEHESLRSTPRRRRRLTQDTNLGSIKLKIPTFLRKNDPKALIEWLKKVESIYAVDNYSDEKKDQAGLSKVLKLCSKLVD